MKPDTLLHITFPVCGTGCEKVNVSDKANATFSDQFLAFFSNLFSTHDWPQRWHCGNWSDFHGWMYILSDIGIWAAYFAIPVLLLILLKNKKDIPFHRVFFLFIAFILLCGLTHLLDAIIFWWPAYRLSALLRLATAFVSMFTVYALYRILPIAFTLRSVSELEAEIEKRRIVEEKLAASEFLLSEAGRISQLAGWELDLITRKKIWSKTIWGILEVAENDPEHQFELLNYFQEPYRNQMAVAINKATREGENWDLELQMTTHKNKNMWVQFTGEPLYDKNGTVIKLRGTLMDIDRYKTNELALNKSLNQISEQNQKLKNFTHILSHNIRNHVSNMTLISSLIDQQQLDDSNSELFGKMEYVTQNLNATLEDLSEAIKIKEIPVDPEIIDFQFITNKVLKILEPDLKLNNVRVDFQFEVDQVIFPRIYLESILINLISNSVKYRNPDVNVHITIKTCKDQSDTVLTCSDNGSGIDLQLHGNKIFGLYKTFHDHKDAHGVGLFLVKTQIESQGGKIEVESTPGSGSTFKITFNESGNVQ